MASIYVNLLEQKKLLHKEKKKISTPTEFACETKMAVFSLLWNTNMAAMKSCEKAVNWHVLNKCKFFNKIRYV